MPIDRLLAGASCTAGLSLSLWLATSPLAAQGFLMPVSPLSPPSQSASSGGGGGGGSIAAPVVQGDPEAVAAAQQFRRSRLGRHESLRAVHTVRKKLRWHESIGTAATEAGQSGKTVLWVQMLGDLDGYT